MRLLFDQNLSPRLVNTLADLFPESEHVFNLDLDQSPDHEVREYAHRHAFTIVTKDSDFGELNILMGFPPKIIWIRRGNGSTKDIENLLRESFETIEAHNGNLESGVLILF
jgi:predicted nuclease of predicted toxin-antitoxin system